jgi:hypothetical protein
VEEGGKILVEGGVLSGEGYESGCYVKPLQKPFEIVQHETLASIVFIEIFGNSRNLNFKTGGSRIIICDYD